MTVEGAAPDPLRRLSPVIRLAPAKVNLTLAVLGRRADGFHDLHSIMVPLDLADRLSVSLAPPGGSDSLHVVGFDAGPTSDNLVLRAFALARRLAGPATGRPGTPPPLAARLEKRIPIAAGLAGGSSDAAAATDAALEAWAIELGPEARVRLAAELGSDVPFFLAGGPALVEGRGERLTGLAWLRDARTPAAAADGDGASSTAGEADEDGAMTRDGAPDRPGLLLVTPAVGISTQAAFEAWDAGARPAGNAARLASDHLAAELRSGLRVTDLMARASVLAAANDLAPAASVLEPGLVPFKRALLRLLGRPVGLSGSGPTHWALYPSYGEAVTAADRVRSGIVDGELPALGPRPPFVAATRIVAPARIVAGTQAARRLG